MTHEQFLASIDRYYDNELDPIQFVEYLQHSQECKDCSQKGHKRFSNRFKEAWMPPPGPSRSQPHLTHETLQRLVNDELLPALSRMAHDHLEVCESCLSAFTGEFQKEGK